MLIMIHFRYENEVFSFLNKKTVYAIMFLYLGGLLGSVFEYFRTKDIEVLFIAIIIWIMISVATIFIARNTKKIKKKYRYFMEDGIKLYGKIVDFVGENSRTRSSEDETTYLYLIVEYIDPDTSRPIRFKTDHVNGNPYSYLSSLDVDVYVKNGEAFATNFKCIKRYKDSVEYKSNHGLW